MAQDPKNDDEGHEEKTNTNNSNSTSQLSTEKPKIRKKPGAWAGRQRFYFQKFGLSDLTMDKISQEDLQKLFEIEATSYNYMSTEELRVVLYDCDIIWNNDIIQGIVDLISEYVGTMGDWSIQNKSDNIQIIHSKDNNISYAITFSDDLDEYKLHDTVLFNQWSHVFDINDDTTYRYVFKVSNYQSIRPGGDVSFRIGIFTDEFKFKFNTQNNNDKDDETRAFQCNSSEFGSDKDGNSMSWNSDGEKCFFHYKGNVLDPNRNDKFNYRSCKNKWQKFRQSDGFKHKNDKNAYFMIEINLKRKRFSVYCPFFAGAYGYGLNAMSMNENIPQDFIDKISQCNKFKIGMSTYMHYCGSFGLGIVRI